MLFGASEELGHDMGSNGGKREGLLCRCHPECCVGEKSPRSERLRLLLALSNPSRFSSYFSQRGLFPPNVAKYNQETNSGIR